MIKIDFNRPFDVLPGDPEDHSKDDPIKTVMAFLLSRVEETKDPVKLWNWAIKLAADGVLEIDKSDAEFLKDTVTRMKNFIVAGKAQVLGIINEAIANESKVILIKKGG